MKAVRRRISDARFMTLLWKTIKAGHIDVGLFRAASEGVPQGGVISPLLSNIMLNEFDQYLHERYLSGKARKDRWYWNNSIQRGRSTAVRENWQWKPAVAYCRYADDFVLIVKGTKAQAEAIREECRGVLEGSLKLRLNMDKSPMLMTALSFWGTGSFANAVVMARCEWSQRSRRRKPETSPHR